MRLNDAKTSIRDANRESFEFLGYTFSPMVYRKTGERYLGVAPSRRQVRRLKASLRATLRPGNQAPIEKVVREVNRKLDGWANYFSVGTLHFAYRGIDHYSCHLLRGFLARRHKVPGRGTRRYSNEELHERFGLVRLLERRPWRPSNASA